MLDLTPLTDLPVLPLRITTRARQPVRLPENPASSLRGAFGAALRDLVCVLPERPPCDGCSFLSKCAYPALFEPKAKPETAGTAGFTDLPRPYLFRGRGNQAEPGERLCWDATLIGNAIEHLPYFVLAWCSMGRQGIGQGRGRFDLARVTMLSLNGELGPALFDEATAHLSQPGSVITGAVLQAWSDRFPDPENLTIRFRSPTSLKTGGRFVSEPHFDVLWRSLQLRLSVLRLAHGGGRPAVDFRESIRRAEQIQLLGWQAEEVTWERFSRRQGRRVPMRGLVGVARYRGELAPFLPALRLGALVGVGDNCTFGLGEYEILENPAST